MPCWVWLGRCPTLGCTWPDERDPRDRQPDPPDANVATQAIRRRPTLLRRVLHWLLAELLSAAFAIGIFAAIVTLVVPVIPPTPPEVRALTQDCRDLRRKIEVFHQEFGRWPTHLDELHLVLGGNDAEPERFLDPWGTPYDYRPGPGGGLIVSFGSDRAPGSIRWESDYYFDSRLDCCSRRPHFWT